MSYENTLEKVIVRLDGEEKEKDKYIAALKQERDLAIQYRADKIAELEKRLIAPTDSGVVALDSICEKFNSNKESDLTELTCSIWNKAFFEALKEQGE